VFNFEINLSKMATVTNLSYTWKICSRLLEKKLFQRNGRHWTLIELTLRQRHGWNLHPRQNTVYPQRSKACTFTNLKQFLNNITLRNKKHRGAPEICYTDMLYVGWLRYIYAPSQECKQTLSFRLSGFHVISVEKCARWHTTLQKWK